MLRISVAENNLLDVPIEGGSAARSAALRGRPQTEPNPRDISARLCNKREMAGQNPRLYYPLTSNSMKKRPHPWRLREKNGALGLENWFKSITIRKNLDRAKRKASDSEVEQEAEKMPNSHPAFAVVVYLSKGLTRNGECHTPEHLD